MGVNAGVISGAGVRAVNVGAVVILGAGHSDHREEANDKLQD